VTYGSAELPTAFQCTVNAVVPGQVTCTLGAATGANLHFLVTVNGVPSDIGVDTVSYPAPTIVPFTLQTPTTNKTVQFTSDSNTGETVQFQGTNFGDQLFLVVKFGPVTAPDKYTCTVQYSSNPYVVKCVTSPGDGRGNRFKVYVGPGTSAQVALGSDIYNFATPPVVYAVSGCLIPSGGPSNRTIGCPTDGKTPSGQAVTITVTGILFGRSGAGVTVSCLLAVVA
jgi:hypothetical protein